MKQLIVKIKTLAGYVSFVATALEMFIKLYENKFGQTAEYEEVK